MTLKLTNTLSGKKEEFKPLHNKKVGMYNCGPTVYNYLHIGNLRTFVMNDLLRRALEANGFEVNQVMNITDVDDKMIKSAKAEKMSIQELGAKYEKAFLDDVQSLNILKPTHLPHATEYIPQMIQFISALIEKGFAYKTDDGVYFDISKSKNYGALAHLEKRTETKSRIASDEYDKENPNDFALWKFWKKEDGEVKWDAPFGEGRPGWHLECSVMSTSLLGETIDIHTGAIDLLFPHHTNEIAQSEALSGKEFVRTWVHGAFLNVGNDAPKADARASKMAKSAGNFIRLADLKEHKIHPLSYRYFLLGAHYRTPLNFSWEAVEGAQNGFEKILHEVVALLKHESGGKIVAKFRDDFAAARNDDLNTPQALATLHALLESKESPADKLATLKEFDNVLGLNLIPLAQKLSNIPPEILALQKERDLARSAKDFPTSDRLRKQIESLGFIVNDLAQGSSVEHTLTSLI